MTVREALRDGARKLESRGVPDAKVDAGWLLSEVTGAPRLTLELDSGTLAPDKLERFKLMIERRCSREPLQYIIGYVDFGGVRLSVDSRALIPRPETELLFERCAAFLMKTEHPPGAPTRVLDLCTGSGALAAALAKRFPAAAVCATDISEDALVLARENAMINGANVSFSHGDLFDAVDCLRFDAIVCNPPYIPSGDIDGLQAEVRGEPHLALDGGDDGLDIIRRVASQGADYLNPGGALFLEIGAGQSDAVMQILQKRYYNITIESDLSGFPRVVCAVRPDGEARA